MGLLILSPLSLLVASVLIFATGARAQGATTHLCPGVIGCANEGLDILVTLDDTTKGHVTRVSDLPSCQSFCHTTKHTFYRFLPRVAPKMPLCFCFDGCSSLLVGATTVGVVASCPQNQSPKQALVKEVVGVPTGKNLKRGDMVGQKGVALVAQEKPEQQVSKAVEERSNDKNEGDQDGSVDEMEELVQQRMAGRETASQKQALVDSIMDE